MKKLIYILLLVMVSACSTQKLLPVKQQAELYFKNDDFQKVIDLYHSNTDNVSQSLYLQSLLGNGDHKKLITLLDSESALKTKFLDLYGQALMHQGKFKQTIHTLRNVKFDNNYKSLNAKAVAFARMRNKSKATYYFKKAINNTPPSQLMNTAIYLAIVGDLKNADLLANKIYKNNSTFRNKSILSKIKLLNQDYSGYKSLVSNPTHLTIDKQAAWPALLNYVNMKPRLPQQRNFSLLLSKIINRKLLETVHKYDDTEEEISDAYNE